MLDKFNKLQMVSRVGAGQDAAPAPTRAGRKAQIVSLSVGGRVHADWTSLWVDSDLLVPADAFEFTLGIKNKTPLSHEVRKGARVQVRIDDVVVMLGRIDGRSHSVGRVGGGAAHSVTLRGRDDMATLVDCSAPVKSAKDLTLMQVVELLVRPMGIAKVKFVGDRQYTVDKISVEPGESAWDALSRACEANGVAAWFDPAGVLTIGGPDYDVPPVATLRLKYDDNLSNVCEVAEDDSIDGVFSELTVLGQSHGGKKGSGANQRALASDPNIADVWVRPKIVVDGDCQDGAVAGTRARKLLADGRMGGYTLKVTVPGFYAESGVLWQPLQRVECDFEPLDTHAVFFLMARRFFMTRDGGKYTQLTLKEDGVWVLDARKKKVKGKRARKVRKSIDKEIK